VLDYVLQPYLSAPGNAHPPLARTIHGVNAMNWGELQAVRRNRRELLQLALSAPHNHRPPPLDAWTPRFAQRPTADRLRRLATEQRQRLEYEDMILRLVQQ
jgi:hypothetical protein